MPVLQLALLSRLEFLTTFTVFDAVEYSELTLLSFFILLAAESTAPAVNLYTLAPIFFEPVLLIVDTVLPYWSN